jgi:hypothetical protein
VIERMIQLPVLCFARKIGSSASLEFTPELKTIALPLIPAFCHILSVAIKPTAAAFVAKLRFPVGYTPRVSQPGAMVRTIGRKGTISKGPEGVA